MNANFALYQYSWAKKAAAFPRNSDFIFSSRSSRYEYP